MICCGVERWKVEREREWTKGKVGEEYKEDGETEWWWKWGRGLEKSSRAAELLFKLTPHSPDQSRQVGR